MSNIQYTYPHKPRIKLVKGFSPSTYKYSCSDIYYIGWGDTPMGAYKSYLRTRKIQQEYNTAVADRDLAYANRLLKHEHKGI